ncbi:MAG: endo-1,4-beta-xylanase [Cyanobacteria bacterium P01_E01_bin.42]
MPLKNFLPNFKIGSSITHQALLEENSPLHTLLSREFDFLVPEWEMKFNIIRGDRHRYNFERSDRIAEFAKTHHLTLRGHCLCWHMSTASWLRKLTIPELEAVLRDHILTTVDRYKGICTAWDVVNEAIDDRGKIRKSVWSQIENFIPKCFQWAREADPDATLIYLDYRLHTPARWNAIAMPFTNPPNAIAIPPLAPSIATFNPNPPILPLKTPSIATVRRLKRNPRLFRQEIET